MYVYNPNYLCFHVLYKERIGLTLLNFATLKYYHLIIIKGESF